MPKGAYDIVVIGGGAAGFFAAIHAANGGSNSVAILEKTNKLLSKVKVSGGGRCNVTHDCESAVQLIKHYPRGGKSLRKGFDLFGTKDTWQWFSDRGVTLKVETDGRVFPASNDSQTIIDCLLKEAQNAGIEVLLQTEVTGIEKLDNGFCTSLKDGNALMSKAVIIASGGQAKSASYDWLRKLGLPISEPIPSLFTFNVPDSPYKDLMGLSVPHATIQIPGTKWKQDGPLLITHWGFSAPAVIKLSAWAAMDLYLKNYHFPILINWCGLEEESIRQGLAEYKATHPKKQVHSQALFSIPSRLWKKIAETAGIEDGLRYLDLSKKKWNRLIEMLVRHPLDVKGKTTFKEEFVTCGGVDLSEINLQTLESKSIPGLYLAGEVLNVDGVTGGFNFQHAWTSGYLAGINAKRLVESEGNCSPATN